MTVQENIISGETVERSPRPIDAVVGLHRLPDPIYNEDGIILYCADCTRVLPLLEITEEDLILTDPPYPDYLTEEYNYFDGILEPLRDIKCKQLIFWTAKCEFPLDYTAIHIWDKMMGVASQYERIFERNGGKNYRIYEGCPIQNEVCAQMSRDIYTGHPSQKPIKLISKLISQNDAERIIDPFSGSGATLRAAKRLGKKAIGIELSRKHCDTTIGLLRQRELF
jgi:hypothetical protein